MVIEIVRATGVPTGTGNTPVARPAHRHGPALARQGVPTHGVPPPTVQARVAIGAGGGPTWYRFTGDAGRIDSVEHFAKEFLTSARGRGDRGKEDDHSDRSNRDRGSTEATVRRGRAGPSGRPPRHDAPVRPPLPPPPVGSGTGEWLNPAHQDTRYGKDLLDAVTMPLDSMGADAE